MSDEVIDHLIDFIKDHKKVDSVNITWYGGEPLLGLDIIKEFYRKYEDASLPEIVSNSIVSNGYLINDEFCSLFQEVGLNSIQITLDGMQYGHNKSRCLKTGEPTFDTIVKNIGIVIDNFPKTNISVRVNIDRRNVDEYIEVRRLLSTMYPEATHLNVYPGLLRIETLDKRSLCQSCYTTETYADLLLYLKQKGIDNGVFPKRPYRGCMIHNANSYVIGPKGEIYKCWNDVSIPDKIIGYINQPRLTNKFLYLKYMSETMPFGAKCRECKVFPLCSGGCGNYWYRNKFENGRYPVCTSYIDSTKLEEALLNGIDVTSTES